MIYKYPIAILRNIAAYKRRVREALKRVNQLTQRERDAAQEAALWFRTNKHPIEMPRVKGAN